VTGNGHRFIKNRAQVLLQAEVTGPFKPDLLYSMSKIGEEFITNNFLCTVVSIST
jgi:hypothetical protein